MTKAKLSWPSATFRNREMRVTSRRGCPKKYLVVVDPMIFWARSYNKGRSWRIFLPMIAMRSSTPLLGHPILQCIFSSLYTSSWQVASSQKQLVKNILNPYWIVETPCLFSKQPLILYSIVSHIQSPTKKKTTHLAALRATHIVSSTSPGVYKPRIHF